MEDNTLGFAGFGLAPSLIESIDIMGFSDPTPVQQAAIPAILEGKDLIACAQTGTGKTAAYLLPIMHKLESRERMGGGVNTIIISPTRELALQIDQQIVGLSYFTSVSSIAVYGGGTGSEFEREKQALKSGADIIVATPGKLISHLNMGYVNTDSIQHLILDEADRMLDMGFYEDIMRIVGRLPEKRQTLMFSATMPPKIRQMASRLLKDPSEINIAISKTAEGVHQAAYSVYEEQKEDLLESILDRPNLDSVIVFSSRKSTVRSIEKGLLRKKINAKIISSDLEQREREEVLRQFRNKTFPVLIATDVLSRGIDIADLDMVLNFDVPHDAEDYVHRVGRTARAKSTGEAITFVTPKEQRNFYKIEKLTGIEVEKPALPESMGKAPEWQDPSQLRRVSGNSRGGGRDSSASHHRPGRTGGGGGNRQGRNNSRRRKGPSRGPGNSTAGQGPAQE
ncbi:DNA/RNA helicase [Flammeovirgaceae bacterium 311]|nr:DNA/RNA helicase [Flammeovirgaceae bacterium 311]